MIIESSDELYEHAPCGYLSTALDGTVVRINATLLGWLGYEAAEVVGVRRFADLLGPGARLFHEIHHLTQLEQTGELRGAALDLRRSDGTVLPALLHSVMVGPAKDPDSLIRTTVFDATERRAFERALVSATARAEQSEQRLRALQQVTMACAGALTAAGLADEAVTAAVSALGGGCGLWLASESGDALQRVAVRGVAEDIAPPVIVPSDGLPPAAEAWLSNRTIVHEWVSDDESFHRAGIESLVCVPLPREATAGVLVLYGAHGRVVGPDDRALFETMATQIALAFRRAALHAELEHRAHHDPLTGLANRSLVHGLLDRAAARSGPSATAVFTIDLNGFKAVNDRFGHGAGDRVLIQVARRLRDSVRPLDTVARMGGDEFVVVCEDVNPDLVAVLAERIAAAIEVPVGSDEDSATVTAAVGYAFLTGTTPAAIDEVLERADRAMYERKAAVPVRAGRPFGTKV